jgi:hypothetical protein
MERAQLEHILKAAGAITRVSDWIVLDATSDAAELYAPDRRWATKMVDLSIGEGSLFHRRFGYFARGVKPPVLPRFWRERATTILSDATAGTAGTCLSPRDAAIARLAEGRDAFVRPEELRELLEELDPATARRLERRLRRRA